VLIGDGPERLACEERAAAIGGDRVRFTGAVEYDDVPRYLSTLDVAVVPARAGGAFHYSPLKLTEYLAMGIASVAPQLGEIARDHRHDDDLLLYEPGNTNELASAIERLLRNDALRARIGDRARTVQLEHGGQVPHLVTIANRLGVTQP
jgi:glycosyltransferase involved in cell wall biosynthesis